MRLTQDNSSRKTRAVHLAKVCPPSKPFVIARHGRHLVSRRTTRAGHLAQEWENASRDGLDNLKKLASLRGTGAIRFREGFVHFYLAQDISLKNEKMRLAMENSPLKRGAGVCTHVCQTLSNTCLAQDWTT